MNLTPVNRCNGSRASTLEKIARAAKSLVTVPAGQEKSHHHAPSLEFLVFQVSLNHDNVLVGFGFGSC